MAAKKDTAKNFDGGRARRDTKLATGSGAPEAVERSLEQEIGSRVRDYRKLSGLTVSELAAAANISNGMLSRIENGQISPSLNTLQLLSEALNVPLPMLVSSTESRRECSYVKRGEGVSIRRRGTKVGHQYFMLGQSLGGRIAVEPYLIELSKDAVPYSEFRHEGTEIIYMLSGEISYAYGDRSYRLGPGDTMMFDSAELHGPDKLIKLPAIYLSVIVYQRA
jgi:transcriptional regulator with XRE-family HTH domain